MRKHLSLATALALTVLCMTFTVSAEGLVGGWAGTESISIPDEVQAAFSQVASELTDSVPDQPDRCQNAAKEAEHEQ